METKEIFGLIVLGTIFYLLIGAMFAASMDKKTEYASFFFWPIALLIMLYHGIIKGIKQLKDV